MAPSEDSVRETNIEVCVRVRPIMNAPELSNTAKRSKGLARHGQRHLSRTPPRPSASKDTFYAWDVIGNDTLQQSAKMLRIQGRTINYTLDQVYGPDSGTAALYEASVRPVVHSSLQGYHGSVFCYGQTSTGKTFTMTGNAKSPGIAPLAIDDIFHYIQQQDEAARDYLIRVSYLEIYNEQIIDLLSDTPSSIRIFESKDAGVVMRGQREEVVSTPEAVMKLLKAGEKRRQVGATNMNKHSSRSHAIVRIWLESKSTTAGQKTRISSLSLVDLAGSESVRLTGSTGERKREGQYINKSLMALGQVIYKLADDELKKNHIPYRDSKLTRLLQPSLSGNAQIVCICNISPQSSHLEESHNTLKFATRAKRIQQRVIVNEVQDQDTLMQAYKEEIADLRQQLADAKLGAEQPLSIADDDTPELVAAIGRMEALILKTHKRQLEFDDDDLLLTASEDSPLFVSPEFRNNLEVPFEASLQIDTTTTTPVAAVSGGDQDLIHEMARIQGLLGNVLTKRGAVSGCTSVTDLSSLAMRDAQVEELRTQLEEQEVTTSLKRADADFLQSQLREKDKLLEEVSKVLEAVEKRQIELEAENAALHRELEVKDAQLASMGHQLAQKNMS